MRLQARTWKMMRSSRKKGNTIRKMICCHFLPEGKRYWAASVLKRKKSLKYHDSGRFYARDVKVVKTNLTSETLKPSGIKTGRKNEDNLKEENEVFL